MALKAALHLETALRGEKTILKKSFCTPPYKLANITEDPQQKALQLMVMSSSPGVLDGDEYDIKISLAKDCCLVWQTQSYQRLFHMQQGATQWVEVNVAEGATFVYLPHPSVPHKGSIYTARNKVHLQNKSALIWSEIVNCGRKLNGEVFQFSVYHSLTEIYINNKLAVKENLLLQPSCMDLGAIGQLEGYTHQATLIFINEATNIKTLTGQLIACVDDWLAPTDGAFGISALPVNGLVVRIMAYKAELLFDGLNRLASLLLQQPEKVEKPELHVV